MRSRARRAHLKKTHYRYYYYYNGQCRSLPNDYSSFAYFYTLSRMRRAISMHFLCYYRYVLFFRLLKSAQVLPILKSANKGTFN